MKRSEYKAARQAAWVAAFGAGEAPAGWVLAGVNADVEAAEAAGVMWSPEDPEEPALPDSLIYFHGQIVPGRVYPPGKTAGVGCWQYPPEQSRKNTFTEAVRRYNAWPELEGVVAAMERTSWIETRNRLQYILRG